MNDTDQNPIQWSESDFLERAVIEAFAPSDSDLNLRELIENWDGNGATASTSIVPFVEQRQFILLDELLPVYAVLRTGPLSEDALRSFVGRLTVTIEARAVGSVTTQSADGKGAQLTQANELLHSTSVDEDEPTVCAVELHSEEDEDGPKRYLYSLWKTLIPIGRPKVKIQKMGVYFATAASLRPSDKSPAEVTTDEFLPSMTPAPLNLLEPFINDPMLDGARIHLSASRINRNTFVAPPQKSNSKLLKTGPRRFFRAAPALLWRVRFIPVPVAGQKDTVIASLDFEIANFASSSMSLDKVNLTLASGHVESLGSLLPVQCQPNDQVTVLHKLLPGPTKIGDMISRSSQDELTVDAAATVYISTKCQAQIRISWKTTVDFSSFGSNTRPTSLPHSGSGTTSNRLSGKDLPRLPGPDSLPNTDQQHDTRATASSAAGVSITISGPSLVCVGEMFQWQILVVNRSEQVQRLALVVMAKKRRMESIAAGSGSRDGPQQRRESVPRAVVDDRTLAQLQRASVQEPTELICLSPDLRIGPLAALACFETEIKFLPLETGVLHVESVRLVDLNTQEVIDITDLPDIVAAAKQSD